MPTTLTPELLLNLPEVGASRDEWGALLNENFTTLDSAVSQAMPIGSVIDFAGPNPPAGWLTCDGRAVSRTTYSDLFAAIGTAWGAGDGSTTFRLPATPGRASVGPGTVTDSNGNNVSFSFGQITGAVLQHIQQTHLPNYNLTTQAAGTHSHGNSTGIAGAHNHTVSVPNVAGVAAGALTGLASDTGMQSYGTSYVDNHAHGIVPDGSHTHSVPLGGGGNWFNVLSPVIVFTKIIFAGAQASHALAAAASSTTQRRRMVTPMRGSH